MFDENTLVGAQLVSFNDEGFTVMKDGRAFNFEYYCYEGDCSSYIGIETELYVNLSDTSNNPVITKVEGLPCNDPGQCCDITLYGLYKQIAIRVMDMVLVFNCIAIRQMSQLN